MRRPRSSPVSLQADTTELPGPLDTPCRVWRWSKNGKGYGYIRRLGSPRPNRPAHRIMYELTRGPIPPGLEIDHLCRRRDCCNPWHLEAVTTRENILRGNGACAIHARQTHCKRGHEFTEENVYRRNDGGRECRICKKLHYTKCRNASKGRRQVGDQKNGRDRQAQRTAESHVDKEEENPQESATQAVSET